MPSEVFNAVQDAMRPWRWIAYSLAAFIFAMGVSVAVSSALAFRAQSNAQAALQLQIHKIEEDIDSLRGDLDVKPRDVLNELKRRVPEVPNPEKE